MAEGAADDYYDYEEEEESHAQMVASAVTPKVAAVLSLFGSTLIITELLIGRKRNNTRRTNRHRGSGFEDGPASRTLLAMSLADIVFSLGWFLSTWAAPAHLDYIWGNVGTTATCNFQGFLIQFGLMSSPLFNIALPYFYLLRIRYRWSDCQIQKIEPWLHGIVWSLALGTAIYPIPIGYYNNAWEICWIESYPQGCGDDEDYPCTRGEDAWIHGLLWTVFPVWISILLAFVIMGMLYATVYQMENKISRYSGSIKTNKNVIIGGIGGGDDGVIKPSINSTTTSPPHPNNTSNNGDYDDDEAVADTTDNDVEDVAQQQVTAPPAATPTTTTTTTTKELSMMEHVANRQKSERVATQAIFYVLAFLTCYLLDAISTCMYYLNDNLWYYWLDIFAYFFLPLQGFLNSLVFMHNRKMETTLGKWTEYILFFKWIPCCRGKFSSSNHHRHSSSGSRTTRRGNDRNAGTTTITSTDHHDDTHNPSLEGDEC